ncbi:MAG TPA: zinc-dependent metalloprotease [Propionibacteriaceae bacterium]|nr:zinc-dependent metalloprotease [Propionibacteriaceae bacterium]
MTNDRFPDGGEQPDPGREFAEMLKAFGIDFNPDGPIDLGSLLSQLQSRMGAMGMFAPGGGSASGINWEHTRHAARQVTATIGPDPTPLAGDQRRIADAERLAELWLDGACDFPQVPSSAVAWSRAEWVERTMSSWETVVEPIVSAIARAMGDLMTPEQETPPELAGMSAMLQPMLTSMAGSMYGMQFAHALGQLAGRVVSGTEIGLQLLSTPQVAVLPTNVAAFAEGLDQSIDDVTLYLTLREAARQRLFNAVGWLGPQMHALLGHYAREISIDVNALESAVDVDDLTQINAEKLAEIAQALQGKLFEPVRTDVQLGVLERLETLLALVEGWVDEVVAQASGPWMTSASALAETVRRRRGTGGPAEAVFGALVGLELRPRRVRDAANLWAALTKDRGMVGRDAAWHHPDLVPTAADLDDPLGYVSGDHTSPASDELDAELKSLLEGEGRGDA